MQRDMELIREILKMVAENPSSTAPHVLHIEGHSDEEIGYHTQLMVEAGLLAGIGAFLDRGRIVAPQVDRLTWHGHDFLEAAAEPERWRKAKAIVQKVGGASLQIWLSVLTHLAEEKVKSLLRGEA